MDILVMEDCILYKADQPEWKDDEDWIDAFELD
jgi:hypothetical protein